MFKRYCPGVEAQQNIIVKHNREQGSAKVIIKISTTEDLYKYVLSFFSDDSCSFRCFQSDVY